MAPDLGENYFQLFGLPVVFRIDNDKLEKKYRELQLLLHPDRYATAGDKERRMAAQAASYVNDAYRTLKDECERAAYLLKLGGMEMNEDTDKIDDIDFLTEQMSLRESLDDCLEADNPVPELLSLSGQASAGRREMLERFNRAWQDGAYEAACDALNKAKFYHKLSCEIGTMKHRVEQAAV